MANNETLMICLDIDGTVVTYDDELYDDVREAIQQVRQAGHHVVLATGRSLSGTLPILDRTGLLEGFTVVSNGSVVAALDPALPDGYEVAHQVLFQPREVLERLWELLPTAAYAVEDEHGVHHAHGDVFNDPGILVTRRACPLEELGQIMARRVVVRGTDHTREEFEAAAHSLGLVGVSFSIGHTAWIDLGPDGVNKASALEVVRGKLGVLQANTVAVGDGGNDIEMLQWASRSAAMGNTFNPRTREVADEIIGHVDEHGLTAYLERFVA